MELFYDIGNVKIRKTRKGDYEDEKAKDKKKISCSIGIHDVAVMYDTGS